MSKVILWLSFGLVSYTYFGYPFILIVLRFFAKKQVDRKAITPTVSMIIAAYNEEKIMREKLENALSLDYPKERLEIIVASDCSTDATNHIVKEYEGQGIVLCNMEKRQGKTAAQNEAVRRSKGEILLFSDAPTIYEADVIKKLVRNYHDRDVGCVTGDIVYTNDEKSVIGKGGGLYWKYESFVKQLESDTGSILGATGCIYSLRRELFKPLDEDYLSDFLTPLRLFASAVDGDFFQAINISQKGVRAIVEPEALSFEKVTNRAEDEFRMRCRVITRAISGLIHMRRLMNPFRYPLLFIKIVSHKVLRWLVPFFLLIALIANMTLLHLELYRILFEAHVLFYFCAIIGFLLEKKRMKNVTFLYVPYYFSVVNLAAFVAVLRYLSGKRDKLWTPIRD